jgi:outer membrane protein assembly factor BamB
MRGNAYKLDAKRGTLIKKAQDVGAIDESFCAHDGDLYSRFIRTDGEQKKYGYARLTYDFEPIWSFCGEGAYSTTSCAIYEDKLIYGDRAGYLYCLDVNTGNEIWRVNVMPNVSAPTSPYARQDPIPVGMPIINKDLIVIRGGNDILGFDLRSSEHVWTTRPAEGLDKPAPADCLAMDEDHLYFTANGVFRKVSLSTGEFMLTIHHDSLGLSRSLDGIVVGDHYLAGFNESHTLAIFNTKTGKIDTQISSDAGFRSAPIWDDGSMYVYDDLARLHQYCGAN